MDRRYRTRAWRGGEPGRVAIDPAGGAADGGGSVPRRPDLPARERIVVAFLLGDGANVMDTAGPWEVFQDTRVGHRHPFELMTVSSTIRELRMSGGLQAVPGHDFNSVPAAHVIVVPAQSPDESALAWLRRAGRKADVTMSVCTGAFHLARAGLLHGCKATTHHLFLDRFAGEFPDIPLQRGARFVDNGRVATAGGLTSGIDLALHIVSRYFGTAVAEDTARYMEHEGQAWRGAPTLPFPDTTIDQTKQGSTA
jgi:transcriptional regulator GlxA family with amidase domain